MDSKARSTLEKALGEKSRGHFPKALARLADAIRQYPGEIELYMEAADVCLEGGEPLQAVQYLKRSVKRFSGDRERVLSYTREKMRSQKSEVLAKFLVEEALRRRDFTAAADILDDLQDHTVRDLLKRTRTKKQSMAAAGAGASASPAERVVHELGEALMSLRLGRIKEAMHAITTVLHEKPAENEVIEPFLRRLEKEHPKSGRIRLVAAESFARSNHAAQAVERLVTAARLEPKLSGECLDSLRELSASFADEPGVDRALAEILMLHGDDARAAEVLTTQAEQTPSAAPNIMSLIRSRIAHPGESMPLEIAYLDAARVAEQHDKIVERLRALVRNPESRRAAIDWLDRRGKEHFFPAGVLLHHAELCADDAQFERTAELLRAAMGMDDDALPSALRILERCAGANTELDEMRRECLARESEQHAATDGSSVEDFEFQHFEKTEFSFSSNRDEIDIDSAADNHEESPADDAADEHATIDSDAPAVAPPRSPGLDLDRRQPVFAPDDSNRRDENTPPSGSGPTPRRRPTLTTASRPAAGREPLARASEAHVRGLADALYRSGAATFFHIEAENTASGTPPPDPKPPAHDAAAPRTEPPDAPDAPTAAAAPGTEPSDASGAPTAAAQPEATPPDATDAPAPAPEIAPDNDDEIADSARRSSAENHPDGHETEPSARETRGGKKDESQILEHELAGASVLERTTTLDLDP